MFSTLFAVVVVVVLDRLAYEPMSVLRGVGWFHGWLRRLDARLPMDRFWRGRFGIALALVPVLLPVGLLQFALGGWLYGLPSLLFGLLVLAWAWGPRDLDRDVDAVVAADGRDARIEAAARLWPPALRGQATADAGRLIDAVFRGALRRWFGVLFWFLLLGPLGALLYRLAAIAAEDAPAETLPADTVAGARTLLAVLDWPVAQLTSVGLALVGNFDVVVGAWKDAGGASLRLDGAFLAAAGRASVRSEIAGEAEEYAEAGSPLGSALVRGLGPLPELRDALSLAWRVLLLWLVAIALFVIAGWVS